MNAERRALDRLRATWNSLGETDPLWAILSRPEMRGGRWDPAAFFAAGEAEVAALERLCGELERPRGRRRALDFGCGVGRVSRALATRYAEVIGLDIAPSMIDGARRWNAGRDNLRFIEHVAADLAPIGDRSVDLVYSVLTLHHVPAALQRRYLAEFLRVLAADGLAVFQLAVGHTHDWRGRLYRALPNRLLAPLRRRVHRSRAVAEVHVLGEAEVAAIVTAAGRRLLRAFDVAAAGRGFRGRMFCVG
jgi:SAM-dependent methyltransferase